MAIIPSDPITDDFNYDKLFQSMNLVTLQRLLDAIRAQGGSGLATEATLALIEAITSQMNFTGGALDVNATISTAGLSTEAKQDAQIVLETAANLLLTSLDGKDFATQTTLELMRILLVSLDNKDYSTETTLALIKPVLDAIKLDTAKLDVNLSTVATETTLAAIKAQTDQLVFTANKLRTTGEDGGGGGAGVSPTWGARVQITVDDTGTEEIPANLNRVAVRISNSDDEECFFTFGDFLPVEKEDIQLKKKISVIFPLSEVGTGKLRFVTKGGKTTVVTYQEAT